MKEIIVAILSLILYGCGNNGQVQGQGQSTVVYVTASPTPTPCSVVPAPEGAQIVCNGVVTSSVGATGPTGPTGSMGVTGDVGATGEPGAEASPCTVKQVGTGAIITCPDNSTATVEGVEMVKLCTSVPDVYPSSFAEYAFCVGGDLYATYWTGSEAFTAKIVSGNYASTSPQGCNFTVYPNCVVKDY